MNDRLKVIIEHLNSCRGIKVTIYASESSYRVYIDENCIGYLMLDGNKILLSENAYGTESDYYQRDKRHLNRLLKHLRYKRLLSLDKRRLIPLVIDEILGIQDV